jgi:hypothetical protein
MLKKLYLIGVAAILMIGIYGCSNTTSQDSLLQKNWGRSFEAAKFNQTLNPEADKNLSPVEGLQGASSERIMEGYIKGREQQKESSSGFGVLTIQK